VQAVRAERWVPRGLQELLVRRELQGLQELPVQAARAERWVRLVLLVLLERPVLQVQAEQ